MFFKRKTLPYPKEGDVRTTRKFAWKPTKIDGGTVWLESYFITECFFQPRSGNPGWWSVLSVDRGMLYP